MEKKSPRILKKRFTVNIQDLLCMSAVKEEADCTSTEVNGFVRCNYNHQIFAKFAIWLR